jgi:hypothetical protein
MIDKFYLNTVVLAAAMVIAASSPARAQDANPSAQTDERQTTPPTDERRTVGTVSSVGRGSIVIRTDEGRFVVYSVRPSLFGSGPLEPGTRVRITTAADDIDPPQTAVIVERLPARQGLAPQTLDAVPPEARRLAAQVERQARRYRAGVMTGAALDPELISINAFATLMPLRQRSIAIRPDVELAFGEVTTLIGMHFDVLYALPGIRPSVRWAPYVGAGPNFSFSHRGIEETEFLDPDQPTTIDNDRFDFSQFDWNAGWNFIVGARNPNGTFFELKATAYGVANIRMLGGFEF